MSAGRYDFVIEQGAQFQEALEMRDSDGNLINLTGYKARMDIRERVGDSSALLELSEVADGDGNILVLGGGEGTIIITIVYDTTGGFDFKTAVYDLELMDTDSVVTRELKGQVQLSKEVTRQEWT